jgi:GTP cyclohydrolase I
VSAEGPAGGTGIAGSAETPADDVSVSDAAPIGDGGRAVRPYDVDGVRRAVRDLLVAVGEDPDRDGLLGTPDRVARAFREMFAGMYEDPAEHLDAVFDIGHEEMVIVRDIPLYSMCEHHLLPFHGVAHVGYIPAPDGRVTGLSKLARLVEGYARRPQVQERLTSQVADALVHRLAPRGVLVVVEAEHLCMSMRGVRKPGSRTLTSAVRGQMRNTATRAEAMSLLLGHRG